MYLSPIINPQGLIKGLLYVCLFKHVPRSFMFQEALLLPAFKFCSSPVAPWASLVAQLVKNPPAMWETWVRFLGWEDPLEKEKLPLQYSGLENSMDCTVHGVARSRTRLSDFHFTLSALARGDDLKEEKPRPLRD